MEFVTEVLPRQFSVCLEGCSGDMPGVSQKFPVIGLCALHQASLGKSPLWLVASTDDSGEDARVFFVQCPHTCAHTRMHARAHTHTGCPASQPLWDHRSFLLGEGQGCREVGARD